MGSKRTGHVPKGKPGFRHGLPILLCLLASHAHAAAKLTIILDWFVNADHAALFAAKYCGAYAKAGLDVTFVPPADPASPPRLLAAGQADLAVGYQTQLTLLDDNGLGLVRIGTLINSPLNTLMALGTSGIHSLADLKGKKIGVSVGGVEEALLGAMLATAGLKLTDVQIIQVNFQLLPALMSHQLDAVMGGYRNYEVIEAQQRGLNPVVFYPEKSGVPPFDELILLARHASVTDPRIARFLAALRQGTNCLLANPQSIWADFIAEHPDLDNEVNQAAWAATLPYLARDPAWLDLPRYAKFETFLFSSGIISSKPEVDTFAVQVPK
jgi:putative hydroxymethylpyrimidine transport system substrate-binding protein